MKEKLIELLNIDPKRSSERDRITGLLTAELQASDHDLAKRLSNGVAGSLPDAIAFHESVLDTQWELYRSGLARVRNPVADAHLYNDWLSAERPGNLAAALLLATFEVLDWLREDAQYAQFGIPPEDLVGLIDGSFPEP